MSPRGWSAFLVGAIAASGCSAVSPTQVGQAAGTIAGATLIPGIGAPLGTLVGTLAGLVIEQQVDKVREQKERTELAKQLHGRPTTSSSASPERPLGEPARVWVDERLEDGRLIAGHFEFRPVP